MKDKPKTGYWPPDSRPPNQRESERHVLLSARDRQREMQGRQDHYEKYEQLAQWLGIEALVELQPKDRKSIREALKDDHHLNQWGNRLWDKQHGMEPKGTRAKPRECPHCHQTIKPELIQGSDDGVWGLFRRAKRDGRNLMPVGDTLSGITPRGWSWSGTVSVLKHVARYHYAFEEGD